MISNNHLLLLIYLLPPLLISKEKFYLFKVLLNENIKSYPSILKKVEKFWAYPSHDTKCPPPHSTGGALDVCLSDKDGNLVEMGSMVDQMDETSNPYFYANIKNEEAIIWNSRRNLLREIMTKFGFAQHPNEWWHFSYGDQLWSWFSKQGDAIYGVAFEVSKDITYSLPSFVT